MQPFYVGVYFTVCYEDSTILFGYFKMPLVYPLLQETR